MGMQFSRIERNLADFLASKGVVAAEPGSQN